jgi:hypothetical protein
VGDAMHRSQHASPVVGILPWGVVNKREEMTVWSGEQQALPYKSTQCTSEGARARPAVRFPSVFPVSPGFHSLLILPGVGINSGHTHFIFVDNGHEGSKAWGSEISFRSALEAELARTKNIPLVQLVHEQTSNTRRISMRCPPPDAWPHTAFCTSVSTHPNSLHTGRAGRPGYARNRRVNCSGGQTYRRAERQRRRCDRGADSV